MSCVAVATSPALAACHSPSVRHRDDPGIFGDVRPLQLVTCLDLLPSSPLLYAGGAKLSPFLSSSKSSPCHSPMPPPSPRVQCSPRTPPSWTSPIGTPSARSVCLCGGLSICSSCSCSLASAPPSDPKWRSPFSLEKRFSMEALPDGKYGINASNVEPASPRLSNSPRSRYSRAMPPPQSVLEAPSPRFGGSRSLLASPRAISRSASANVRILPSIFLDQCAELSGDSPAFPFSWDNSAENLSRLDLPKDRDVATPAKEPLSTPTVIAESCTADVAEHSGLPSTPPLKRKRPPRLEIPRGGDTVIPSDSLHAVDLSEDALNDMTVEGSYYGISCKKGRRETLEDTQRAIPDLHGDPGQAFFGVFDGHGGRKAADFAAENLVVKITDAMDSSNEGEGSVEAAVRAGYLAADADFLLKRISSGASCVTAIIKDGYMVVANAGDCRAVLCRAGAAEALTCDHRAGREDERERIENLGGFVDNSTGTWRVQGILAVSRGIGDLHLKEWISAEPDVQTLHITPDCEFLILASDGLWDTVTNQEAVETARALLQSERIEADVMDLQIPLAMASSSLSKTGDERDGNGAQYRSLGNNNLEKKSNLKPDNEHDVRVPSTGDDDDELDMCVGTMDADMPNVGFPEPQFPSSGPVAACRKLVEMSAKRGCHDDISVMVVNLQHFHR